MLEQNYRSRQNILDVAMGVIDRAQNRKKKRLFSDRGEGEKIFFSKHAMIIVKPHLLWIRLLNWLLRVILNQKIVL
ncbi:MAG: hypothetical protein HC797_01145 [Anaerolineales bacterium]|nr:hypothetical protein [Anaerolineales bacterium]